jgi:hypothetical protein
MSQKKNEIASFIQVVFRSPYLGANLMDLRKRSKGIGMDGISKMLFLQVFYAAKNYSSGRRV